MASGIILPALFSIATSSIENFILSSESSQNDSGSLGTQYSNSPWTPPQYSQPALTVLSVPASSSASTGIPFSPPIDYVFDAVFKVCHSLRLHKTQHPVLTGANISDHAYVEPARVVMEVGMSDAMASFSEGVWVGFSSKSISTWQILKNLQLNRTLLTITSRLNTYYNMLLADIHTEDENRTQHGLRATLTFEEILSGSVYSRSTQSARPQTTANTYGGVIQSFPPNQSQIDQNVIPSTSFPDVQTYPTVPGAGSVSSNSLAQATGT